MMLLLLMEAIKRSESTDQHFFEACYYWKHNKNGEVFGDVLAFRVQSQIPQYVKEYLAHAYDI